MNTVTTMFNLVFLLGFTLISAEINSPIQEFTKANNVFAQSFYKQTTVIKTENFCLSPFSAETLLSLVHSGARGNSAEELRIALHLPSRETIESAMKTFLPHIKSNEFSTANKIYIKKNYTVYEEFKKIGREVFVAEIENIDFKFSKEAADKINNWVEDQTNNKIKNLIDHKDLTEDLAAVLINALYFRSNWSKPFNLYDTKLADFYHKTTESVQVKTLHKFRKHFNYFESQELEAQFLELPFENNATMVFVLPNEKDGLARLEKNLNKIFTLEYNFKDTLLNIALPKFKIDTTINLKKILKKLGVESIFNETQADLSGIAEKPGDLYIGKAEQKTFIEVSEDGVEAAAATFALPLLGSSGEINQKEPKNFIADHPFIFFITVKDLILFAGRVTDPSL